MAAEEITVRQFLAAALAFMDDKKCSICKKGELHLVWIDNGNEREPILWWIACSHCETEFACSCTFTPAVDIPEGA